MLLVLSRLSVGVSHFLELEIYKGTNVEIKVGTIVLVLVIVVATHLLLKVIKRIITRTLPPNDKLKFNSIFTFIRYFVFVVLFFFVLSMVGVNVSVFLTASAALFVGLGFALQQLFQDIIAGIYMILDQSLHVGDVIAVDGKLAKVVSVNLRATHAVTRDDRILIIPNHKFLNDIIFNWTQNGEVVRTQIEVGVYIGSDLEKVKEVLYDSVKYHPEILEDPAPIVMLDHFGDSSVRFLLHFYLNNSFDNERITSEVRFEVYRQFYRNGIQLPVPVIRLHDGSILNKGNMSVDLKK